jgi:hypothetical protein
MGFNAAEFAQAKRRNPKSLPASSEGRTTICSLKNRADIDVVMKFPAMVARGDWAGILAETGLITTSAHLRALADTVTSRVATNAIMRSHNVGSTIRYLHDAVPARSSALLTHVTGLGMPYPHQEADTLGRLSLTPLNRVVPVAATAPTVALPDKRAPAQVREAGQASRFSDYRTKLNAGRTEAEQGAAKKKEADRKAASRKRQRDIITPDDA